MFDKNSSATICTKPFRGRQKPLIVTSPTTGKGCSSPTFSFLTAAMTCLYDRVFVIRTPGMSCSHLVRLQSGAYCLFKQRWMPSYFDLLNIPFRYNAIKQRVSALLLLKLLTVSDRMSGITFFHICAEFLIRSLSCLSDTVWMNVLNKPAIAGSSLLADAPCARLADFNVMYRADDVSLLCLLTLFSHCCLRMSLLGFL